MNAAGHLSFRPRLATFSGAGATASGTVQQGAAAVPAVRSATIAQLSHRETAQLSHQYGRTGTRLTKAFAQRIEIICLLSAIRRSFGWHAGCWLGGVGTHLDNRASRDRLCRRGNLEGACRRVVQSAAGAGNERGKRV